MSNKTFCILPWMHLATNASGSLRVCCNSTPGKNQILRDNGKPYHITDKDAVNFWNSQTLKTIRTQFLNNEKPDMCVRCFREEDIGIKSARQSWNDKWMFDYEESITPPLNIKYVDIRLGNLCNLKCRMCNPYASNQWVDEWHLIEKTLPDMEKIFLSTMKWPDDDKVAENLLLFAKSIQEIYLTGGEPTLAISQYKLFDKLIELGLAKGISLKYNTNCTNLPKKLVDYWQHFKKVKINASIDAIGDLNRYIRYPTGWSLVEKNLLKFKELEQQGNFELQVHNTVQVYNILYIDKFLDYLSQNQIKNIYFNILNHPEHLNIRALPLPLKEQAKQRLLPYLKISKVQGIIDYMFAEDWNQKYWDKFKEYTNALDNSRQESILDNLKEFNDWI
jgi:sulfatase maturation enzyme AslB (radical SAM superfamily)